MNNNKRDELAKIFSHHEFPKTLDQDLIEEEKIKSYCGGWDAAKADSAQEIDTLKKKNERLREALRFVKNCLGSFKIDAVMIDKINEVLSEHETKGEK